MKRCRLLLLAITGMMMLMLTACTPTPEKEKKNIPVMETETTEAFKADTMEIRNKGSENLPKMAAVSIYRIGKNRNGLVQEMDNLETEELDAQAIVDLLIQYGALEEGVEVISFQQEEDRGVLNVNKITSAEDEMEIRLATEALVNTFTENYELESGLILQVNGEIFTLEAMEPEEDGTMYYNANYQNLE